MQSLKKAALPEFCSKPSRRPCVHHAATVTVPRRLILARQSNDPSQTAAVTEEAQDKQPAAAPGGQEQPVVSSSLSSMEGTSTTRRKVREAETTDAVASFLSRRFGLAGGLAWLGFLAIGTLGEQVKTRMEVAAEKAGTKDVQDSKEVVLPSGVTYRDLRVGGGQQPIKGYLVLVDYIGRADGVEFENTKKRGKPIVYLYGSRPFTGGMCQGIEEAMATMKAGGKRIITVPPELGFGDKGFMLRPTEHVPEKQGIVPPGAQLEYEVELVRVSIPPS